MEDSAKRIACRLFRTYVVCIGLVIVIIVTGLLLVYRLLESQAGENRRIHLASDQRTLSQTITKKAILIQFAPNRTTADTLAAELVRLVAAWTRIQYGLELGDDSLQLSGQNSAKTRHLFASAEPYFQRMAHHARKVGQFRTTDNETVRRSVHDLLADESHFVYWMDAVVAQYHAEAQARIHKVKLLAWISAGVVLTILITQGFLVIRPAIRHLVAYFSELLKTTQQANDLNAHLEEIQSQTETLLNEQYALLVQSRKSEQELKEKQKLITTITQLTPNILYVFDRTEKRVVFINHGVTRVLGYSEAYARTMDEPGWMDLVHADDRLAVKESMDQTYALPDGEIQQNEYRIRHRDGHYVWLLGHNTVFARNEDGTPTQRLTIAHDITQRKDAEQTLITAKEQAIQSAHATEVFLSTMSHEIRTPLNAVIGMTHLLLQEHPRPDQRENLDILRFSAENLLGLINDVLDFNKIEAGMISFEEIEFNLHALLTGVQQTLLPKAEEKGLRISLWIDPALPDVLVGDPVRLSQIFTNLVSNAVKFTEWGLITVDARLHALTNDACTIHFAVTDTGIGIAADKLAHIFERFTQASSDTTRKFGGTGLGLAITKRLIELQNSRIDVESTLGVGTRFSFQLTFKPGTSTIHPAFAIPTNTHQQDLSHVQVLLVEDNVINQKVAAKFLEKWGITPDFAENGKIALAQVQAKRYDMVLMDLQMPEMDGYEATRLIRKLSDAYYRQLPIIALTASAMLDVKDEVFRIGMTDYVTKPFDPKDLFAKIAHYAGVAPTPAVSPTSQANHKPVPPSPLIDHEGISTLINGESAFQTELIQLYLSSFQQLQQEYARAVQERDLIGVKSIKHKMQPTIVMLGIEPLKDAFSFCEQALAAGHPTEEALLSLINEMESICKQIIQELQTSYPDSTIQ